MTDTVPQAPAAPTFTGIALVHDPDRAAKVLTGRANLGRVTQGILRVTGPRTLEWMSPDGIVTMRGITFADVVREGLIGIDYGGESGPAVAVLVDRSRGLREQGRATAALGPTLRAALGLPPKSQEEKDEAARAALTRAEAKLRSARTGMIVPALVCVGGAIATAISYSNAEPGEGFTLWWGAIVFGLLWFIVGWAEYAGAAKEKGAAQRSLGLTTEAPATLDEAWGGGPVPLARPATEPVPPPPPPPPPMAPPPPPPPMAPPPPPPAPPPPAVFAPMPPPIGPAPRRQPRVVLAVVAVAALLIAIGVGFALGNRDDGATWTSASSTPSTVASSTTLSRSATVPPTYAVPTRPSVTATPPTAHAIPTSIGPVGIFSVSLTDQYPAGCQPSDVLGCQTVSGNRLVVLVIGAAPGHTAQSTMEAITAEFFNSTVYDNAGGIAGGKQIARLDSGDTTDLVYEAISVENPTSLVLKWPGASPISLEF